MSRPAYYNEIDPFAAAWLRELITRGHIAPGDVDTRSIADVRSDDLVSYGQCHFFAGIGGWSYALRLAGIPDDAPIWTGSCPCQPFSVAGRGAGVADERHLWPELRRLIGERRPSAVLGEQVAGRAGLDWLASVRSDLEGLGYGVGAADLCAAGVGAPHIRQRIYWGGIRLDDTASAGRRGRGPLEGWGYQESGGSGSVGRLADAERQRLRGEGSGAASSSSGGVQGAEREWERLRADAGSGGAATGRMGHPDGERCDGLNALLRANAAGWDAAGAPEAAGADTYRLGSADGGHGGWRRADWIRCREEQRGQRDTVRWRPLEPGTLPMDARLPKGMARLRKGSLRGYGNSIVPQLGAVFASSFLGAAGVMA